MMLTSMHHSVQCQSPTTLWLLSGSPTPKLDAFAAEGLDLHAPSLNAVCVGRANSSPILLFHLRWPRPFLKIASQFRLSQSAHLYLVLIK